MIRSKACSITLLVIPISDDNNLYTLVHLVIYLINELCCTNDKPLSYVYVINELYYLINFEVIFI